MEYVVSESVKNALAELLGDPAVRAALKLIEADQERSIGETCELTEIESPTFHEEGRAAVLARKFQEAGLADVHIDRGGNVVGLFEGLSDIPKILVEGHMDTVFPFGSVHGVHRENGRLYAPGVGDDTRALAMILSIIRAMKAAGVRPKRSILFVGTTREEGMGSLGGMKDFLTDNREDLAAAVSIDNGDMAGLTYQATGFRTYEVIFHGKGGHAEGAFGEVASPLSAAARAVAKIAEFRVPEDPRTTFCISNFHAGTDAGVHAFPAEASIKINFRSNSQEELEILDERIFRVVEEACEEETARWGCDRITWDRKIFCDVPAGTQDPHAPIVEAAMEVLRYVGQEPFLYRGGSTNGNMTIAAGLPAVVIGRGWYDPGAPRDNRNHTLEENFPERNAYRAVQAAFLTAMLAAGTERFPGIL